MTGVTVLEPDARVEVRSPQPTATTLAAPEPRARVHDPLPRVDAAPPSSGIALVGVAGPRGGDGNRVQAVAGEPLPRLHVATIHTDGRVYLADADDPDLADDVVGVTATNVLPGEQVDLVQVGDLDAPTLPAGPLYLGTGGALTTDPEVGAVMLQLGLAVAGRLIVNIQRPIHRAP